jgi:CubicO group peptidase (beta-lactamase class C family)
MRQINLIQASLMTGVFLAASVAVRAQGANAEVDAIFADLTKPGSPGCALGVYRNGKIIYAKGYGLANIEENVPITPQTIFDIGSISKQFTAAAILLLEKQGRLRLDDDVRKYIPELPDYSPGGQRITILHLLNHTSGLRDYVSLFLLAGIYFDNVTTDDDALGIIARQKGLNFTPGTDWKYTGSGYLLLSLIVQRVSGKALKDFAAENIFQPLGMTHTQFRNDHTSLIPNRALAYERDEKGVYKLSVSYAEQNGDGMVHTSIEDLQKWDENFYSGRIGGKDLVAEMQEPGELSDGKPLKYAKGLFLRNYRGLPTIWHSGESGGYLSYLIRFPEQHFSIACLCNGLPSPFQRSHRIATLYLGSLMKPSEVDFATAGPQTEAPAGVTRDQLRGWPGDYRNSKTQDIWRVTDREGMLWLDFEGVRRPLRALSSTEFEPLRYVHQIRLKFEAAQNGVRRKVVVFREMEPYATLDAVDPLTPSVAELTACAGNYWSDELRATYRLVLHDSRLWMEELIGSDGVVRRGIIPVSELRPLSSSDEFDLNDSPLVFHFIRDKNSNVTGFVLNGFSERGILFTRVGKAEIKP